MYTQKISIISWQPLEDVRLIGHEQVPRSCYCRFEPDGSGCLKFYTTSECGQYAIAEGRSDGTAFLLLRLLGWEGRKRKAEYLGCCYNPMDETYSHLTQVHWYMEEGFCKLEFFRLDTGETDSRRIRFLP